MEDSKDVETHRLSHEELLEAPKHWGKCNDGHKTVDLYPKGQPKLLLKES